VRCRGEAEYGDDGLVRRAHGAFQDITRHKEAQLRENQLARRLSNTLESITDAFFTLDSNWCFTYINKVGERLLRRSRDSLLGKVIWEAFPEALGSTFEIEYRRAADEGKPIEFEEFYPPLDMWFGVRAFPTPEGLAVYFSDITATREARRALQVSEERFQLLSKATNDAIWDWDLKTDALWWNEGFEVLFGYSPDEVKPDIDFWCSLIHPDERDGIIADIEREIAGGGTQWTDEYRFLRRDGTYAFVMDRGYIIRDDQGIGVRMIGGMTDITSRKEAEARLVEQAALLDLTSDAIIVRCLRHRVLFWNRGAEAIYGWRSDEVLDKPVDEFLYKETEQFSKAREAVLRDGTWTGELQQCTKSGGMVTVLGRWTLVRDASGQPEAILSFNTDITERKRLEQQFLRAQRMESIGTLAGGIAHDLNNVLAPILMAVEILKDRVSDKNGMELLDTMGKSAQRGADLIKQVLSFARGVEGKRIALNPAHIVHEVQKIVYDTFPRSIYCEVSSPRDLWVVEADPTQLHQVLMNLCVNARDAMPEGGRIEIVLENRMVDEVYSGMNIEAKPGPYVMIKVKDSGTGIPKDLQEKIFEPFFTTKDIGKGTGLGLSTTFTIIRDHGGFINLYSEPGKGTKFKVYLPASVGADEAERVAVGQTDLPRGHGELIMVVDDEEGIREVAQKVLERYGYRVILANNGAEGVSLYVLNRLEIAVVLTDMSMPIMDGPAMIVALKSINPGVHIIASSGLAMNESVTKALGAGVEHFVPKPYTAEILLKTIDQVLEPGRRLVAIPATVPPPSRRAILLAHGDPKQRSLCQGMLDLLGYPVHVAESAQDAIRLLQEHEADVGLVLLEVEMALSGLASVVTASSEDLHLMVIGTASQSIPDLERILGPRVVLIPTPIRANYLLEKIRALFDS
jgi:PAS domain S-box-containing protein